MRIKPWWWIVGAVVLLVVLLVGSYNGLVRREQAVQEAWSQVEVQYQRRADLIPQLVDTVSGIAAQERNVLLRVTELRSQVGQLQVEDLGDAQELQSFASAQDELGSALSRLLVVVENYPQIASQENFLALQAQIEGTENRIAVARRDYNTEVTNYNNAVKTFPRVLIARLLGFDDYERFEADPGAEDAPEVDFDIPDDTSP